MNKHIVRNFISLLVLFLAPITIDAQSNWIRTNPGGGGAVSMLTGTANGTILAGSDLSGVYKSTDNGQSWTPIGSAQGLTATDIISLAPHASNGNTFYIGTGAGIFKTTDGGQTVSQANVEFINGLGYVEAIEMCSVNQNKGYAAHHEWWSPNLTLLKTIDGGNNWFRVTANNLPPQGSLLRMMAHPLNDDLVYALFGKGRENCSDPWLYKSIDGGWNWTRVALNLGDILDFDLHPTDQQLVFASTFQSNGCGANVGIWNYVDGTPSTGELYRSMDAGANFVQIGEHTGFINVGTNANNIAVTNYLFSVDWSVSPPTYNSAMGTWKSSNGGGSWTKTGNLPNWDKKWPILQYAYTNSFYGLNKTVTKDKFNSGNYYAAYGGFAWTTTDGGDNFTNVAAKDLGNGTYRSTGMDNINGNALDVSDADPNTVYVGYYDLGFWYTRDRGLSWKFSVPDVNTYPTYVWDAGGGANVNFVLNDPERANVVWATFGRESTSTYGAIFKSTAYGENWQISNTGLQSLGKNTHGMSIDLNSDVNNRTLYVTQDGDVFKSTDDGASWTMVLNNGGLKFTAVDHFNSQLVYAGGENGFWQSTNGGATWAETGLPEMRYEEQIMNSVPLDDIVPTYADNFANPPRETWNGLFEIKAAPNTPNRVYATAYGPNKGAYRSNDGGLSWDILYTNNYMRSIAIHPSNPNILYISSSSAYHSGGNKPGTEGFLMSEDGGTTWTNINSDMSWALGGRMEIDKSPNPRLWAWSPGTGIQYTEVAAANSDDCITIDNDFSDWSSIPTLSTSNGYTIKTADGNDVFYIYVNGNLDTNNQFFLDADNDNSGSGEYTNTNWGQTGFNFLIQNNTFFRYTGSGSDWTWSAGPSISVQKTSTEIELKIDKSYFSSNTINFGFTTRDANWAQVGYSPVTNAASYIFSNSLPCTICSDGIQNGDETSIDCGGLTCSTCPLYFSVKAILQGAFTGMAMRTDLNAILPSTEPYTALGYTHVGGGGGESSLPSIINTNDIVDWVVIELRDKNDPSAILATRSALLKSDGSVVSHLDGSSPVVFRIAADDYYIAIRHRNHLGVMTNTAVSTN